MADLITTQVLATWTQNDPAEVAADPFALEVVDKVSRLAQFLGGHPEWTLTGTTAAPFDVQMVVLQVAKRTYANPDQEVSTTVGPLGSRVLDTAALLTDLTETERRTLVKYNVNGDPDSSGSIWVLETGRDPINTQPDPVLYVPDDSLSDWYTPMFSPGDPGDPALYVEP